jgi:hypothetical protein
MVTSLLLLLASDTWITVPPSIRAKVEKNELVAVLHIRHSFIWGANLQRVWESYLSDYCPLLVLDIYWRFDDQGQMRAHSFRVRFRSTGDVFIRIGKKR